MRKTFRIKYQKRHLEESPRNRLLEIASKQSEASGTDIIDNNISRLAIVDILMDAKAKCYYDQDKILITGDFEYEKEVEFLKDLLINGHAVFSVSDDVLDEDQLKLYGKTHYDSYRMMLISTDITENMFPVKFEPSNLRSISERDIIGKVVRTEASIRALRVIRELEFFKIPNSYYSGLLSFSQVYKAKMIYEKDNKNRLYSFMNEMFSSVSAIEHFFTEEIFQTEEGRALFDQVIEVALYGGRIYSWYKDGHTPLPNRSVLETMKAMKGLK